MTTIAWDGTSLAGDRQSDIGFSYDCGPKIVRTPDGRLLGGSGYSAILEKIMPWLAIVECARGDAPEITDAADRSYHIIEVSLDGSIALWTGLGRCSIGAGVKLFAVGSGSCFALGAMHAGKDAGDAVAIACRLDTCSGKGIDVLTLEPPADAQLALPPPTKRRSLFFWPR